MNFHLLLYIIEDPVPDSYTYLDPSPGIFIALSLSLNLKQIPIIAPPISHKIPSSSSDPHALLVLLAKSHACVVDALIILCGIHVLCHVDV